MTFKKLVLASAVIGALGTPSLAGQCGYQQCWGAVGIGPGGAWGFSHSYPSEQQAYDRVVEECQWNCDVIQTFWDTCGSIASASNGAWGFATRLYRDDAQSAALDQCWQYGGNDCTVTVWACSP